MTRTDVYVLGVGAVTPLGPTWARTIPRLAAGETAVREVEQFDTTGFPSRAGAWVTGELADGDGDRRMSLLRGAASEALAEVDLDSVASERIGVFIGAESGRASPQTILELSRAAGGGVAFDHEQFGKHARALARRIDAGQVSPAAIAARLAGEVGALGPNRTVSIACASGATAIAEGVRALRLGHCDLAICGGVGADVDPLMLAGFGKLGALSAAGISRPFDLRRDGFVVGEGAAVAVLATAGEGPARVSGIGLSLDGHHLTAPHPEGRGAVRAMSAALEEAGRPRVDCVQAHGTSTPLNDVVEARAIAEVVGDGALVSSVKGALGHWVAGAGAIGFVCAVESVRSNRVWPTACLTEPDPECAVHHVIGEEVSTPIRSALVNSFAFGGANCSLVVESA